MLYSERYSSEKDAVDGKVEWAGTDPIITESMILNTALGLSFK